MATIYRSYLPPARARWASNYAAYNAFKRAWPTTTIDGIRVYQKSLIYWQGGMTLNASQKRFINKIGLSYEELASQSYEGVENCYFKLNGSKYTYEPMDAVEIANDLSNAFAIGDEFEVAVSYGGDLRRYTTTFIQPDGTGGYTVDTAGIRAMLNSDRVKYFANAKTEAAGSMFQETETSIYNVSVGRNRTAISTPVTKLEYNDSDTGNGKLYDCLAMLDDGTTFQEIGINTERVTAVETKDQYGNSHVIGEYSYIVKFRVIATPTHASYITTQCSTVANAVKASMLYTGAVNISMTNHAQDTLIKQAVLLMSNPSSHPAFYNGYLRVDYCASIKRKDFVKIFGQIFDSGYTKKKTKWYEKVIAIVIIIIAVVITFFFGPVVGALFLSIATMLYAAAFPHATQMIRLMGHVALVLGISAGISNIYNIAMQSYEVVTVQVVLQVGSAVLQSAGIAAMILGDKELGATLMMAGNMMNAASSTDFAKGLNLDGMSLSEVFGSITTEVTKSISELPQTILDSVSDIASGSVLSESSPITMGQVGGWMKNLDTAMKLYSQFFITPYKPPVNSEDQASKESGVAEYYEVVNMIDNTDLLDRVSKYRDDMFGGEQTEMYIAGIA